MSSKKENKLKEKAQKHIEISLEVKKLVKRKCQEYCVYLATHPTSNDYKEMEKKSEGDFWSLKLRTHPDKIGLKDPDLVITEGDSVKYLIEVKWGAIKGCTTSDVESILKNPDLDKIKKARCLGGKCSVHGPFVKNGHYCETEENKEWEKFDVDDSTKFILVSDFKMMKEELPDKKYEDLISQLKKQKDIFNLADINKQVDDIPSLEEII